MGNSKTEKVYLVGAGPGDPGLCTLRAASVLGQADLIIYDWLVNPRLLELAPQAEKIYVGKHRASSPHRKRPVSQDQINRLLVQEARKGRKVVRLKGGDPFVFGRGGEEAVYLARRHIPFHVVPGVSALNGVPAYAGIPITDRTWASQVVFVTAHEGADKPHHSVEWEKIAKLSGTLVLFMGVQSLGQAVERLTRGGKSPKTPVAVVEWGTFPYQRTIQGNLKDIVSKTRKAKLESPALTIIGEVNRYRKILSWFEKRPLYGKTVLITRAGSQASQLRHQLEEKGAEVLEGPAIEIAEPEDWTPLDEAVQNLRQFDWIVFTSTNGAASFFHRLHHAGKDSRALGMLKIAAIGEATKQTLGQQGILPDFVPSAYTSEALLRELRKQETLMGQRFLLPRTQIAPPFLRVELEKLGARVTEVIAYRTLKTRSSDSAREIRRRLLKGNIDAVTFTSASTVQYFFEPLSQKARKKLKAKLYSIGPVTSQTLRRYGLKPYREAKEHTIPGLVKAMVQG